MQEIQVAAGVIADSSGNILLAKRPVSSHQGGLWEFPGGKIAAGESLLSALRRELNEELGINVGRASPLIRVRHPYPEFTVVLHVFRVEGFTGRAVGREGQEIRWVALRELQNFRFPEANLPILAAIGLPSIWPILNEESVRLQGLERRFDKWVERGVKTMQIRCKKASPRHFAIAVKPLCAKARCLGLEVVLNSDPELVADLGAAGVHLDSTRLAAQKSRPLPRDFRVGASCHNLEELRRAEELGLDYAFLSPVRSTASHPGLEGLGWETFASWVDCVNIPVYALGGMTPDDLDVARARGAQGIAGIGAFME